MSILEYIVLSLALSIETLLVVRKSAFKSDILLSRGLLVSFIIALIHSIFLGLGILVGNLLMFGFPEVDNLVYLGLMIVVAGRLLVTSLRKNDNHPSYEIKRISTTCALAVATGVNVLFVGLALGFRVYVENDILKSSIPLFVLTFMFAYWAIMLGRREVEVNTKRWGLIGVLFLLIFALKGAFFS